MSKGYFADSGMPPVHNDLLIKWQAEQEKSKEELLIKDTEPWQLNKSIFSSTCNDSESNEYCNQHLRYVAGLDISFVKGENTACSGLFVFDLSNNMELVYEDLDKGLIEMQLPYVSGYLAYREAPFLLSKLQKLKETKPHLYPHCIMIDGNGSLHKHKFGMACHIGLLAKTPTIGVSKKLSAVFGLENNSEHKDKIKKELLKAGDHFELMSDEKDPVLLGYAYRSTNLTTNPIYASPGHMISWETMLWILKLTLTKYRIPEPIRQADLITREYLRKIGSFKAN